MPRRNRVDPWGDLHAVAPRGLLTGNRGCVVDDHERVVRRRADYSAYRDAVTHAIDSPLPLRAWQLNERLEAERHRRGRGLVRAGDRIVWSARYAELPDGTVVVAPDGSCRLVIEDRLLRFSFDGWGGATPRPFVGEATVLTPPTSVAALAYGYQPVLHPSTRTG